MERGTETRTQQRREAFRAFMSRRGLTPKSWADKAKVSPNTLYNYLNGISNSLRQDIQEKLAAAENVSTSAFTGETERSPAQVIEVIGATTGDEFLTSWRFKRPLKMLVPKISVKFTLDELWNQLKDVAKSVEGNKIILAEGGLSDWLEEKYGQLHDEEISEPVVDLRFADMPVESFGVMVRDRSFEIIYQPFRTVLLCIPPESIHLPLAKGARVVLETIVDSAPEVSAIKVREHGADDHGRHWLWPRSTQPEHQQPEPFDPNALEMRHRDRTIKIIGQVYMAIQWEHLVDPK